MRDLYFDQLDTIVDDLVAMTTSVRDAVHEATTHSLEALAARGLGMVPDPSAPPPADPDADGPDARVQPTQPSATSPADDPAA